MLDTPTAIKQLDALLVGRAVPDDLRRWMAAQARAAGELVFRDTGRTDAAGASIFEVGQAGDPRQFAARRPGVRLAWLLVRAGAEGKAISALDSTPSGAENVRQKLARGREEIARHSPELAATLARFEVTQTLARWHPPASSPRIDTTNPKPIRKCKATTASSDHRQKEPTT